LNYYIHIWENILLLYKGISIANKLLMPMKNIWIYLATVYIQSNWLFYSCYSSTNWNVMTIIYLWIKLMTPLSWAKDRSWNLSRKWLLSPLSLCLPSKGARENWQTKRNLVDNSCPEFPISLYTTSTQLSISWKRIGKVVWLRLYWMSLLFWMLVRILEEIQVKEWLQPSLVPLSMAFLVEVLNCFNLIGNHSIYAPTWACAGYNYYLVQNFGFEVVPWVTIIIGISIYILSHLKWHHYIDFTPNYVIEGFYLGLGFLIFNGYIDYAFGLTDMHSNRGFAVYPNRFKMYEEFFQRGDFTYLIATFAIFFFLYLGNKINT